MANFVDVEDSRRILLWDIDGTLITPGTDPLAPFRLALAHLGFAAADIDISVHGLTDLGICQALVREQGSAGDALPRTQQLLSAVERVTLEDAQALLGDRRILPGVRRILAEATDLGWTNAVATGNSRTRAELKLDIVGLRSGFDWTVSGFGGETVARADVIDGARDAFARRATMRLRACGAPYDIAVVVVGDTPSDMRARRLGDGGIGVATGVYSESDLHDAGANLVVASLVAGHDAVIDFLNARGCPTT